MSSTVEQIKERLPVADVVGSYITLEKAGNALKARCPFHSEKTPSFFVSPERNTYYCFGCGAKGDIFTFVSEFESLDFLGALKVLAERAGIEIEKYDKQKKDDKERLYDAMEEAAAFFQSRLKDSVAALMYLKGRNLSIEMVRSWRLGFAPAEWRALKTHMLKKGWSEKDLLDAGLIKQGDEGTYDRFRNRIMFPIFDTSGRVIAFSGRTLSEDKEEAKYLNSPETPLFAKSKTLYGLHKARNAIRERGSAVLVEGQMDLLMSHQAGVPNTVASSGTALTPDHLSLLKRSTDTVVIAYDSDMAGQNAAFKAFQLALSLGLNVKLVALPKGSDPADVAGRDASSWKKALEESRHIVDHFIGAIKKQDSEAGSQEERDRIIKQKILPLIKSIDSPIVQSRFIQKVGFESGLAETALWDELKKTESALKEDEMDGFREESAAGGNSLLRRAYALVLWLKQSNHEEAEKFEAKLREIAGEKLKPLEPETDILMFEAQMYFGNSPNLSLAVAESLYFLEEESLKGRFAEAMLNLKKAEAAQDEAKAGEYLQKCQALSRELSNLSARYFNKTL